MVVELNGNHERILRHDGHGDLLRHRQTRHEVVDDLLNALLISVVGNHPFRTCRVRHRDVTWEYEQEQTERQNAPRMRTRV